MKWHKGKQVTAPIYFYIQKISNLIFPEGSEIIG